MRNLKKFLALVLALMMTFSLMVTVNAATPNFSEDAEPMFQEAIDVLTGLGVIKGVDNGDGNLIFRGERPITRAEAAAIVYRLYTGDVNEERTDVWAGYADFDDVSSDAWYAGVVGYCASNGLIQGDGTNFAPQKNVTGYEMLAMLLRAVGYDRNDEFTGSSWQTNVSYYTTINNILVNVNNSSYKGRSLTLDATREMVAEIAFQAAVNTPTVIYTPLGGYSQTTTVLGGSLNPTLAEKWFDLVKLTGIIVGNQQTGEDYTMLGVSTTWVPATAAEPGYYRIAANNAGSYVYANDVTSASGTNATLAFDYDTGLDKFGHKVDIWFDGSSSNGDSGTIGNSNTGTLPSEFGTVYCVRDLVGKTAVVYAASAADLGDSTDNLTKAVGSADFYMTGTDSVYVNDSFCATTAAMQDDDSISAKADQNVYLLISNGTANKDGDYPLNMVIALDVYANKIDKVNNYSSPKTVNVDDTTNTSTAIDRSKGSATANLLVYGEDAISVGQKVVTMKIAGTQALTYWGFNALTQEKTGVIKGITSTGKITLDDNTVLEKSPLYDMTANSHNTLKPSGALVIGATMTFTLDESGKYVGAKEATGFYMYGTYAWWEQTASDKVSYYLQGVTLDGQKRVVEITAAEYEAQVKDKGMRYLDSGTDSKVFVNEKIVANALNSLYYVDSDGAVLCGTTAGKTLPAEEKSGTLNQFSTSSANIDVKELGTHDTTSTPAFYNKTFTAKTTVAGHTAGADSGTDYLSNETQYHVITGFGSTLEVKTYTGLEDLLDGATTLTAKGIYVVGDLDTEDTEATNKGVSHVIIEGDDMLRVGGSSFLYSEEDQSSTIKDKKDNYQFELRVAGEKDASSYMVNKVNGDVTDGTDSAKSPRAHTFYTYSERDGVYSLVDATADWVWTTKSLAKAGTVSGYITDGSDRIYAKDAKVIDLTGDYPGIVDYETLRQAVDSNRDASKYFKVDVLRTAPGEDTAAVIYVYGYGA